MSCNPSAWCISVPTKEGRDRYLTLEYVEGVGRATFSIPVTRTLADVDDSIVRAAAKACVSRSPELARMQSHTSMLVDRGVMMAERAYQAGYLQRLTDERRASCVVGRDQLGSIVRVATGWPIFDMRQPLVPGGGQ